MPELPEVQVVINYLKKYILNKKIIKIDIYLDKLFKNIKPKDFINKVVNHSFIDIKRRGKYLIFILDNNSVILSHLRMEGKYNYTESKTKTKHDHVIYEFDDGTYLKYNDSRQFGTIEYYSNLKEVYESKSLKKLGVEPFSNDFNTDYVYEQLHKSNKKLKTFLLDQTKIAGIGNIYANEICFYLGLNPETMTKSLSKNDAHNIVSYTKQILNESIKHNGTTIHSFTFNQWKTGDYQNYLMVHGNKQCKRCNQPLIFKKVNGRGTYYCEKCQRLKKK